MINQESFDGLRIEILYLCALDLARRGSFSEAEEILQQIAQPNLEAKHLMLWGKIYAQQKMYAMAVACWEKVLALDPGNKEAYRAIERAEKLRSSHRMSPLKKAALGLVFAGLLITVFFMAAELNQSRQNSLSLKVENMTVIQEAAGLREELKLARFDIVAQKKQLQVLEKNNHDLQLKKAQAMQDIEQIKSDLKTSKDGMLAYQARMLAQALAKNDKTAEWGITVSKDDGSLRLNGQVPTKHIKNGAFQVAAGIANGVGICCEGIEVTQEYHVLPGDSLSRIARKVYGDPYRYEELILANPENVGPNGLIHPGIRLVTP